MPDLVETKYSAERRPDQERKIVGDQNLSKSTREPRTWNKSTRRAHFETTRRHSQKANQTIRDERSSKNKMSAHPGIRTQVNAQNRMNMKRNHPILDRGFGRGATARNASREWKRKIPTTLRTLNREGEESISPVERLNRKEARQNSSNQYQRPERDRDSELIAHI